MTVGSFKSIEVLPRKRHRLLLIIYIYIYIYIYPIYQGLMSYIGMFGNATHKTLHVVYRSYQQKNLNQTRLVSFLIGGTREKIRAENGSPRIYIRIPLSVFGSYGLRGDLICFPIYYILYVSACNNALFRSDCLP